MPDTLDPAAKTPKRRTRLQYSLRALLIAVWSYCLLWLLTAVVGGNALLGRYAERYRSENLQISAQGRTLTVRTRVTDSTARQQSFRGTLVSPAPFVLLWRWEEMNSTGDWLAAEKSDVHLWLLGYRRALREQPFAAKYHCEIF